MTPEQAAAFVTAQAACANAEVAAMTAANAERIRRGESAAYTDGNFMDVIDRYTIGHNAVLQLFQDVSR